jgi:hypothetical protein
MSERYEFDLPQLLEDALARGGAIAFTQEETLLADDEGRTVIRVSAEDGYALI